MAYITKLQVDSGALTPIGSSLFGVCNTPAGTAAKVIDLASDSNLTAAFDTLVDGVTVHIKFTNGNTADANQLTLKIGNTDAKPIANPGGGCNWSAGAITSFTYDGTYWCVNDASGGIEVTIDSTYSPNSGNAISGEGVADALSGLDGSITGTPGTGKTLTVFSETDGIVSATFADIAIANTQVSGLGTASVKDTDSSITDSSTSTNVPTTQAVASYVANKVAGLTGAMHFIGSSSTAITDGSTTSSITIDGETVTPEAGDVVLYGGAEYVWTGGAWEILGDEGSYALKSRQENVVKTATLTPNTLPTLTVTPVSVPNVTNAGSAASLETEEITIPKVVSTGSAMSAVVQNGVLQISTGSTPTLDSTPITVNSVKTWSAGSAPTLGTAINIGSASGWDAGSQASLSQTSQTVVIP